MPDIEMPEVHSPALGRLLLRIGLPRDLHEPLIGDLEEELHHQIDIGVSRTKARLWYWDQVLRTLVHRPPSPPRPQTLPRRGDSSLKTFQLDSKFALRSLRRSPGFAFVAILILAIGIGSTTAIYSIVDAVVLAPLPYEDPEQLVMVGSRWGEEEGWYQSYLNFSDLRRDSRSFSHMAAWQPLPETVEGPESIPMRLDGALISHELLPLLGLLPAEGRNFTAEEDTVGNDEGVVLVSRELGKRCFGEGEIIGKTLRVDNVPHTVVGVLPEKMETFLPEVELVRPLSRQETVELRGVNNLRILGRLEDGVSPAMATADLSVIADRLATEYPEHNPKLGFFLEPYHDVLVSRVRSRLFLLLGAVVVVLLIACANISNLLLERAAARTREVATRRALGASGRRLALQFSTEALVLTTAGSVLGLGIATLGTRGLLALAPTRVPLESEIGLDLRVLAFTLVVSALTALVFGLAPLWELGRQSMVTTLRSGGRSGLGRERHRLRKTLVIVEVALAAVLVVGAGLMLRTLERLGEVDPGFRHQNVLAVDVALPTPFVHREWRQTVTFFGQLAERLEQLPGVESVSGAYHPAYVNGWNTSFEVEGWPEAEPGEEPEANYRPVLPGYFRTLGIPLIRGRVLDSRDHSEAPGAVVVNEAFVRTHFPDERAIGKRIDTGAWWGDNPSPYEIVGVVKDVKFRGLDRETEPAVYYPHAQVPVNALTLLLRTQGNPLAATEAVRRTVRSLDANLPLGTITTVEAELAEREGVRRFMLTLLAIFAAAAVLLAALGLYAVLAYGVMERYREFGVRLALGARPRTLLRMVLEEGLGLTLIGLAVGWVVALGVTRFLEALLFGVAATDPTTFAAVGLLLLVIAALATLVPAWRATRVDPIEVLRYE